MGSAEFLCSSKRSDKKNIFIETMLNIDTKEDNE